MAQDLRLNDRIESSRKNLLSIIIHPIINRFSLNIFKRYYSVNPPVPIKLETV